MKQDDSLRSFAKTAPFPLLHSFKIISRALLPMSLSDKFIVPFFIPVLRFYILFSRSLHPKSPYFNSFSPSFKFLSLLLVPMALTFKPMSPALILIDLLLHFYRVAMLYFNSAFQIQSNLILWIHLQAPFIDCQNL